MAFDMDKWAASEVRVFLRAWWVETCLAVAPAAAARLEAEIGSVLDAYEHPARHYHNLFHINDCQGEFRGAKALFRDPAAASAALIFHDTVYDPTRHDNEERSADWAELVLADAAVPRAFIDTVRRLILATKHQAVPSDPDAQLVADIDLAILGRPLKEFRRYEWAIRQEYAHVPDVAFAAGRAKVLRHFLGRPSIYATPTFRARYEVSARRNLERALAKWEAGGPPSSGGLRRPYDSRPR